MAARRAFSPPKRNTPAVPPACRRSQEPRIMGLFRVFTGSVNRLTPFRNAYLARQERRTSETVSGGRLSGQTEDRAVFRDFARFRYGFWVILSVV